GTSTNNPLIATSPVTINGTGAALNLRSNTGDVTFDNSLTVNQDGALEVGSLATAAATITVGSATRGITINGKTLPVFVAGGTTLNGPGTYSGSGNLNFTGANGTANLNTANSFTGNVKVGLGTGDNVIVAVSNASGLGPATNPVTVGDGGTLGV